MTTVDQPPRAAASGLVPGLVGVACLGLGAVVPLASPLLVALLAGVLLANVSVLGHDARAAQARFARTMLRLGVVLVGLRLPVGDLVDVGVVGLVVIATTVGVTFLATCMVGDRLGLERGLVTLVAAGFSVCGAAAIAAVESCVRRRDEDAALAVAMVTIFGTAMIVIQPMLAAWLGLSDRQTGIWLGASIHEVAQVVAAAAAAGAGAVAVATTIKLGRVATLAIVCLAARVRDGAVSPSSAAPSGPPLPWFVVGFLIAVGVRATGLVPGDALHAADLAATGLLAAGMFGLGLGIRMVELFPLPGRVVLLATISTATATLVSGVLVIALT